MFNQDPDHNIGFLMHDVSRRLRDRFDRRARAMGLTRAQWRVLVHLGPRQGINQSTLAEILELDNVTLGRHIDNLQADGWLERRPDPDDRRAWRLHLTPKVEPILERMEALVNQTQAEALNGIGETDKARLLNNLLAMKQNMLDSDEAVRAAEPAPADVGREVAGASHG